MKKNVAFFTVFILVFLSIQSFAQRSVIVQNKDTQPVPVKNVNTANNPVPVTNTNSINNPVPVKNVNSINDPALVKNVNSEKEPIPVKVINQYVEKPQAKELFMQSSTVDPHSPLYGKLTITAGQGETKVIEFVHSFANVGTGLLKYSLRSPNHTYYLLMANVQNSRSSYAQPFMMVLKNGESVEFEIDNSLRPTEKFISVTGYILK